MMNKGRGEQKEKGGYCNYKNGAPSEDKIFKKKKSQIVGQVGSKQQ